MAARIRPATSADWDRIAALREEVGWSVRRWALDAFRPPVGAAWVADADGRVVGCGSGIVHGRLGIVGNMVVARTHRRQGIASAVLRAVLAYLEPRTETIELNATADGRPVYERFGFSPVIGYLGAYLPAGLGGPAPAHEVAEATDANALAAWDGPRFGGSRLPILAAAIADGDRRVLVARRTAYSGDGEIAGYAVARPAEAAIGPFVADAPEVAATLLAAVARRDPAVDTWRITLPGDNHVATTWLRERGVLLEPHGTQMRRGAAPRRRVETIWGTGAGAIG